MDLDLELMASLRELQADLGRLAKHRLALILRLAQRSDEVVPCAVWGKMDPQEHGRVERTRSCIGRQPLSQRRQAGRGDRVDRHGAPPPSGCLPRLSETDRRKSFDLVVEHALRSGPEPMERPGHVARHLIAAPRPKGELV